MLRFLADNIYVVFGDQVFQQSVGVPMGTNCAPLLADLFSYSYDAEFVQKLTRDKKQRQKNKTKQKKKQRKKNKKHLPCPSTIHIGTSML